MSSRAAVASEVLPRHRSGATMVPLLRALCFAAAVGPAARSQTTEDMQTILASHPGCFFKGFQYTPDIPHTNTKAAHMRECQQKCREMPNCKVFAFFPYSRDCYFGDWQARMVESPFGAISGFGVCPEPTEEPPDICRTELPKNGFPGLTPNTSNAAWPSGRQPWSLECWPKNWTGGYIPCQKVKLLQDTSNGWPGKCVGLARQEGHTYVETDPNTKSACQRDCMQNPLCASWQTGFYGQCWQGVGQDCFVRENFNPIGAQRLQHGEVRKLMDLTGWQIVGLYRTFDNKEGYFLRDEDAVDACKSVCYSDIRCQFWQYSPKYGCYVEDVSKEYRPPYPLTLDWAYRSTSFALSCIAGEYIQHYCPDDMTTAYPTEAPEEIATCMVRGKRYEPANMVFTSRTVEMNAAACQMRCRQHLSCAHFAFWPDGGCHLQDESAHEVDAEDFRVVTGPPSCGDTTPAPDMHMVNAETNWLTKEGAKALSAKMPGPNIPPSPAPVTLEPSDSSILRDVSGAGYLAEISMTISNLDSASLTVPERRQLKFRYLNAISQGLSVPITEIKDDPYGQPAEIKLLAQPPAASRVVAYVPARRNAKMLQAMAGSSRVVDTMKQRTVEVLGDSHSAIRGDLKVEAAARVVAVQPTHPPQQEEEDSSDSWWWPVLVGCGLLACVGGLLAGFLLNKPKKGSRRKIRAMTNSEQEESLRGGESDWESRMSPEEGDASIWDTEPSWDSSPGRPAPQPPRDPSLGDVYSSRKGETIFEA